MKPSFIWRRDTVYIAVLAVLVVGYFFTEIFSHLTFASRDIYMFFNPRRYFAAECIRGGTVPLWNPYVGCGVPFLANLQSSIFYPLSLIYYLLPFQLGFKIFIIFHYLLGGCLMYFLMRHWRYGCYASLFSAVTFMFGGYLVSIMDNVAFLTSAVWLPLVIILWDKFLQTGRATYGLWTGAAISLQIFGGDFSHYVLCTFIFMATQLLYWVTQRTSHAARDSLKRVLGLPAAWGIGLGLAMIVLLPFLEFAFHSTRMEGIAYEVATRWSYHPLELLQLVTPYVFGSLVPFTKWLGQAWIDTVYIGIAPLCLAIFAGLYSKDPRKWLLLGLLLISLFLSMGKYNPLFKYAWDSVPGIRMLQIPAKFLFLGTVSLSIMAGIGWETLVRSLRDKEEAKLFKVFLVCLSCALILAFLGALLWKESALIFLRDYLAHAELKAFYTPEDSFAAIFKNVSTALAISGAVTLLFGLALARRLSLPLLKTLLVAVAVVELFFVAKPQDQLIPQGLYHREAETSRKLPSDRGHFRTFSLSYLSIQNYMNHPRIPFTHSFLLLKNSLIPNLQMYQHIATIDEFAAVIRKDYNQVLGWIKQSFEKVRQEKEEGDFYRLKDEHASSCTKLLGLLNVRFITSLGEFRGDLFSQIGTGEAGVRIYENANALPRAFLVSNVILTERSSDALPTLGNDIFNPREFVIFSKKEIPPRLLEELMEPPARDAGDVRGTVEIVRYGPNSLEVEVATDRACFLILSESYYPGWKAYMDGKETELLKANFLLRGIRIREKGKHRIDLTFDPFSYKLGKYVSASTLLILLTGLVYDRRRRSRSHKVDSQDNPV